ncbi:MAG: hypothetical protein PHS97_02795 [Oscillospiraceae bacterium]|nr:hypothetical protein [Oscillospiraceae bacterium]
MEPSLIPPEWAVFARCSLCGGEIYLGEAYYAVDGKTICCDCADDYGRSLLAPFARVAES